MHSTKDIYAVGTSESVTCFVNKTDAMVHAKHFPEANLRTFAGVIRDAEKKTDLAAKLISDWQNETMWVCISMWVLSCIFVFEYLMPTSSSTQQVVFGGALILPFLAIFKLQDKRLKRQMLVISELDAYDEALNGELSKAIDQ